MLSSGKYYRHATPELHLSIDEKNRKIFADASASISDYYKNRPDSSLELDFTLCLYLVGYNT